ncbi:MAG: tetratricopeptide repeat protein [Magnetococcales bacterium]|nr:tetratricopeptide repeat protein [Magnetococcales bacterium]
MIHSEIQLSLSILRDQEPDSPFRLQLTADGKTLCSEKKIKRKQYQIVHHIADACRQLLKSGGNPELSADTLTSAGTELFSTWFAPFWSPVEQLLLSNPGQLCHLTITSNLSEVLFLPWELLQFPNGILPSLDKRFGLRRLPKGQLQLARCCPTFAPGPLKVLFMVSAPNNSGEMDFFAEEKAFKQSLESLGRDLYLEVADSGTFDELQAVIHQYQPHVVHLVGPALNKNEKGYFGFEDEIGNADIRSATEMANHLFKHSGVQAVILSGRDLTKAAPIAALAAVARELVELGTPLAVAWGESLTHPTATTYAETLYTALAEGKTIDQALSKSRRAILEDCEKSGYPSWISAMLFSTTNQSRLFNVAADAPRIRPEPLIKNLPPLAGLALGPVLNHRFQRRAVQRLLPQLLDGSLQSLLLTGPSGTGKSTLASHLAQNLQRAGFTPIAVSGTAELPLTTARILSAIEKALVEAGCKDEQEILVNPRISQEDRLGFVAALMNRRLSFVLVLDGFEWSLDPVTNRFIAPTLAPFFFFMLDQINGNSRFIATSRVTPVSGGPAPLSATCREEKLTTVLTRNNPEPPGLDEMTQRGLSRAALMNGPIPTDAIAALIGDDLEKTKSLLSFWHSVDLVFLDEQQANTVWHIIRPLPERLFPLDDETAKNIHRTAGDYLLARLKANEIAVFQKTWLDVALETLNHFILADDSGKVLEVSQPINVFYEQMGFHWDMEQLNKKLLLQRTHPRPLYKVALAQQLQGQFEEARATLQSVLNMTEGHQIQEEALALFDLATLDSHVGDVPEALRQFNRALDINRVLNDTQGLVACLIQIGMIQMHNGNGEEALPALEEALQIQRRIGTPLDVAQILPWIGDIYFRQGDTETARQLFLEALPTLQTHQDTSMEAQILHQLATLDLNDGEYLDALKNFQRSLTIKRESDDQRGEAATLFQLGRLAKEMNDPEGCLRLIGLCYRIDQEIGQADAEQERRIFDEIAESLGLDEEASEAILNDVWICYKQDRGQELIEKTFKKRNTDKIIPINRID